MTYISITKCDGPGCNKQINNVKWDAPIYHTLIIGGSDFEMSTGRPEQYHFCSLACLRQWIEDHVRVE